MQIYSYQPLHNAKAADLNAAGGLDAAASNAARKADKAVELQKGFGRLLDIALQEPDRSAIVAAARQALRDGTLETPQAFEDAANTILTTGI